MADIESVGQGPHSGVIRVGYALVGAFLAWRWATGGSEPAWEHGLQVLATMAALMALLQLARRRRIRRVGWSVLDRVPLRILLPAKVLLVAVALGAQWLLARWTSEAQSIVALGLFLVIAVGGPVLHRRGAGSAGRPGETRRPLEETAGGFHE
ncbi:hypothetical protein [Kitasatospora sp. GP82]|uniref:hypothetical protein n=1 Tax=Kitasatospora sp. GP82 TaxID=3035089 RepID=UPI002475CC1A|nr:hypothetical protein [Kitasatospora sp. GP82]MDH6128104.1 cytochrome bd-type quinol oxidase subunit 1 [Kitasatospora sp. GP82]